MKKRNMLIAAYVLLAAVVLWVLLRPSKREEITLETAPTSRIAISNSVTATGTVEPVTEVEVGTQVSGIIDRLYVDYNDVVKAGQLIAEMDKVTLQAELESSEAELASCKTEYEYQSKNYARTKTLHEKELVSDQEYDEALYLYEKSRNAYAQSQAAIVKVKQNLDYATITSPIDGVVISRAVEEGQTVAAGFETPTLFTIANDLTQMRVIADVDEADIGQVADGQRVQFTVDAYPDDTFEGTVEQVRLERVERRDLRGGHHGLQPRPEAQTRADGQRHDLHARKGECPLHSDQGAALRSRCRAALRAGHERGFGLRTGRCREARGVGPQRTAPHAALRDDRGRQRRPHGDSRRADRRRGGSRRHDLDGRRRADADRRTQSLHADTPGRRQQEEVAMETSVQTREIIRLENIRRDFRVGDETVHALRGVSFTIREGEFVTIMGTSGSGKSTLLNTLGCLDTPTAGEYYLDGISVRTMDKNQRATLRNRKIGFVFQNYNLLPKTTAIENVELPLMYNPQCSAAERRERAVEALKAVGLGDRLLHRSNQMSGGQMQRVAIARALVNNPAVILADEATGNLDTRTSFEVLVLFQQLHAAGRTIIFVTHNPEIAQYSSRNITLRDGRITDDRRNEHPLSAADALARLPRQEE